VAELIVLGLLCAIGVPFMVYVLIGTQLDLNRQKRAGEIDQKLHLTQWRA